MCIRYDDRWIKHRLSSFALFSCKCDSFVSSIWIINAWQTYSIHSNSHSEGGLYKTFRMKVLRKPQNTLSILSDQRTQEVDGSISKDRNKHRRLLKCYHVIPVFCFVFWERVPFHSILGMFYFRGKKITSCIPETLFDPNHCRLTQVYGNVTETFSKPSLIIASFQRGSRLPDC